MKLTFGKYNGVELVHVPQSYLLWLSESTEIKSDALRSAIEKELDMGRVTLGFGKYRDHTLSELPNDYLVWLMDNPTKSPRINAWVAEHVQPIMPIGKFKGQHFGTIEASYKQWILENDILKSTYLRSQIV